MGRRRQQGLAAVDRDLLGVCRGKLALLVGDGVLVGWLLHHGGVDLGRPPWIGCAALVVVGGALVGALAVLARNLLATIRLAPEPAPLGGHRQIWYATVAVVTLGFGLMTGSTLAGGQHREAGLLLTYGAALAQMVVGFGLILRTPLAPWSAEGAGAGLRWGAVFLGLIIAGGCIAASPAAADAFLVTVCAMPLWHGLFFLSTRPLFDRCFEPGGTRSGTSGPPAGRERIQVLVAALLPLGGVAVPSWLRLRERLRKLGGHE